MKLPFYRQATLSGSLLTMLFLTQTPSPADEGMWLYNAPPSKLLKERHGFEPTPAWLEHVRKSSVRFNSGGSGSFVSEDGLIISNHHVGSDDLHKLSDAAHDYLRDGFYARTRADEKRCLDLELNVLMEIEDVTAQVNAAVKPGLGAEEAFAARRAAMAAIEKQSLEKTGLRSDVVTLYQGGQYHLYRYKRYTDVRLVFAPEQQIAFFGGDPDNFEYPRFNLDICLFRAYEDGKPAKVPHHLVWSRQGVSDNELIFVSGNPGNTSRKLIPAELDDLRDRSFPYALRRLYRLDVLLTAWSARDQENARRARELLFGVQNSRKARLGFLAGLQDPQIMASKQEADRQLREAIGAKPELKEALGSWDEIAAAQRIVASNGLEHSLLESGHAFNSTYFHIARTLWRGSEENGKPNGERLREFRDSNRASLELDLFSEEPLYDDFETLRLADSLSWLAESLGHAHPMVRQALAGKSPRARASELVSGTKVKAVAFRKKLWSRPSAELMAAQDPMIDLVKLVDPEARRLRKVLEAQEERKKQAYARIADARSKLQGAETYPDATFTLRLAFGLVKGYQEDGRSVPFQTALRGLYERAALHQNKPPYDLPPRWLQRKAKLNLDTPFNFVSTADIIGGNSGSPVVNRAGEFVGIIFDGNIQSLVLDFVYTDEQARALSVNSQAVIEALRKVYNTPKLVDELLTGKAR